MYNLNVNVAATTLPASFLGLDGQCNTPRTPEIVNSLVAMTNPFDALVKPPRGNDSPGSEESYSGTVSPLGSPANSPPSVQHTRSQLIKEGLKLTIQTKRKHSGSDTKEDLDEFESKKMKREELTEEDEERRKRRRERNKIAATKCRMKKREKTANLVNESELLETQNVDLKAQIQDLQKQKRKLMDMLSMHSSTCLKRGAPHVRGPPFEAEFAGTAEPFADGFDESRPAAPFCGDGPEEFEVGSTAHGTAMNPYGKDPNFAGLVDEVAPSADYSRPFERPYVLPNGCFGGDSGVPTTAAAAAAAAATPTSTASAPGYYQVKGRINMESSENRSCYHEYQSEKKSAKEKRMSGRIESKRTSTFDPPENAAQQQVFNCCHESDDADSYKPNGIIDGNFFANRTDVFATGNEYVNAFGSNSALDNGCMA